MSILTTIKPADVSEMSSEERKIWNLKNIFDPIYRTIMRLMRNHIDPTWRPAIDACHWATIAESGGDPRANPESLRNVADIDSAFEVLDKNCHNVVDEYVTCSEWRDYTAITNGLARIGSNIRDYEELRARLKNPSDHIEIRFSKLLQTISIKKYFYYQDECADYGEFKDPASEFPWVA